MGRAVSGHPVLPAQDELVAAVSALLVVGRRADPARPDGPAPADWRSRRLAALGLSPRRRT